MVHVYRSFTLASVLFAAAAAPPNAAMDWRRPPATTESRAPLPRVVPESVGMSSSRLASIDEAVRKGISAGGFPGAAVIVGRHGAIVWERGYGTLDWQSGNAVDAERTMYDVASLTKVVATTAAAMVLVDRGKLNLDERVSHYLPSFSGGGKGEVTIRQLLTHRSGLPSGRDLPHRDGPDAARRAVLATSLERTPGSVTEYSDLGPDVLGFVIERITGEPLDRFVQRTVYAPLGMRSTMFRPPTALKSRVAPTINLASRGEVHDPNARALGGVAGHAGLFSTAADLAVFAQAMLDTGTARRSRIFSDSIAREFTRPGPGWRGLGWQTCPGDGSCGQYFSSRAFGHTGFTGTSMWVDPERDLFVIVLTNWAFGRASGGVAPVAILHDVRADVVDFAALSITDADRPLTPPWRFRSELQDGWWSGN